MISFLDSNSHEYLVEHIVKMIVFIVKIIIFITIITSHPHQNCFEKQEIKLLWPNCMC